jgi:hypothetical protein
MDRGNDHCTPSNHEHQTHLSFTCIPPNFQNHNMTFLLPVCHPFLKIARADPPLLKWVPHVIVFNKFISFYPFSPEPSSASRARWWTHGSGGGGGPLQCCVQRVVAGLDPTGQSGRRRARLGVAVGAWPARHAAMAGA